MTKTLNFVPNYPTATKYQRSLATKLKFVATIRQPVATGSYNLATTLKSVADY